ncbi:MAG: hypothetical protein QHJ82_13530, partial [Verrucomicrobiota bacterium]|nr:hypothetical protein [Verrucomicrobiota bacterium]
QVGHMTGAFNVQRAILNSSTCNANLLHRFRLAPKGRTVATALLAVRQAHTEKMTKLAALKSRRI